MNKKQRFIIFGFTILFLVSINAIVLNLDTSPLLEEIDYEMTDNENNVLQKDLHASETDYYTEEWITNGEK